MRQTKGLIKLLISALMLWVALRFVSLKELEETLASLPVSALLLVITGYFLGQIISSIKWWTLARSGGRINASYLLALKAYFVGMYVNCFAGFGTLGGDVTRGVLIGNSDSARTEGVFSVVADRLHGLLVLSLIAFVSIAVFKGDAVDQRIVYGLYGLSAAILVGWFVGPTLLLSVVPKDSALRPKVEGIASVFPRKPGTVLFVSILSIIFHLIQLSLHRVMGAAVGVDIPWEVILTTVPFINILSSLPISWQGLGVREYAYTFFLGALLTDEKVAAFGAMWICAMVVCSAIGGVVAVVTGDLKALKKPTHKFDQVTNVPVLKAGNSA